VWGKHVKIAFFDEKIIDFQRKNEQNFAKKQLPSPESEIEE